MGKTGKALDEIVTSVTGLNDIIEDISARAAAQTTRLDKLNAAVNDMDEVTQQNAAMAEQAQSATQSLAQETSRLGEYIGQFRVGEPMALAA